MNLYSLVCNDCQKKERACFDSLLLILLKGITAVGMPAAKGAISYGVYLICRPPFTTDGVPIGRSELLPNSTFDNPLTEVSYDSARPSSIRGRSTEIEGSISSVSTFPSLRRNVVLLLQGMPCAPPI